MSKHPKRPLGIYQRKELRKMKARRDRMKRLKAELAARKKGASS